MVMPRIVNPTLYLTLEEFEEPVRFSLRVEDTQNNTDISDFSSRGRIYRYTMNCVIDDARMFFKETDKIVKTVPVTIDTIQEGV